MLLMERFLKLPAVFCYHGEIRMLTGSLAGGRVLSRCLPMIGIVAAGLLLLFLCTAQADDGGDDGSVEMLTIADSTGDWGYPSPYGHYSRGPGYVRMSLIFDTLTWKDEKGIIPALAESWEMEGDDAYTFKLRDDVLWHDGERFTANDVLFTIDYIKEHPYMWVSSDIIGTAEATDDYTVRINLKQPYAPFLELVAGTLPILPEHIYKGIDNPAEFRDDAALVGTGPFQLVDYDQSQGSYLYKAYDDYYLGSPRVKQLRFVKVNLELSAAALEKGDVNAANVPPEVAGGLKDEGFTVMLSSHDSITKIMVNHKKEPLSNPTFRQALYYAIDRQALVDNAARGYGVLASPGLFAVDNSWYNPHVEQYDYEPAKTEELMEGLGYTKVDGHFSKEGSPVKLEMLVTSTNERTGELIRQQLEEAGFIVSLRTVDSKTLDSLVTEWKFDLALNSHGGMGADPEILKRMTGEGYTFNSARYTENPELNELLEQEVAENDEQKRKALIDQIQVIHAQELPVLPLYYADTYWAHDGTVNMYYTKQGIANGVPIALNKQIFVS